MYARHLSSSAYRFANRQWRRAHTHVTGDCCLRHISPKFLAIYVVEYSCFVQLVAKGWTQS